MTIGLRVLLCLVLLMGLPAVGAEIHVDDTFSEIDLAGQLSASTRNIPIATAEEALARYRRGEFEPLPGNLGRGYTQTPVWVAFDLEQKENAPYTLLVLEVAPALLDHIRVFQVEGSGPLQLRGIAGDQVPHGDVRIPGLVPAFSLQLQGTAKHTVLVEIQTTSTQSAFFRLYHPRVYPSVVETRGLLLGGIFLAGSMLILVALGLFFVYQDWLYLLWLAYVADTLLVWAVNDGLLYRYLHWLPLPMINQATTISSLLSLALGSLLITQVFEFARLARWLHRAFVVWSLVLIVVGTVAIALNMKAVVGIVMLVALPLMPLSLVGIAMQWTRGHREARYFGPAFACLIVLATYNMVAVLGLVPYTLFAFWGWQLASLLNLLSMQYAMVSRARSTQAQSEAERVRLLALLSQQNRELETKVDERTRHLNQALQEGVQREKDQQQFIGMLSHEVRSPMAVIDTTTQLLAVKLAPSHEAQALLARIRRGVARLSNFFDNSLTQDRVSSAQFAPHISPIDMADLAHWSHETAELMTDQHAIHLNCEANLPPLLGDRTLLRTLLANLLSNAIKYSPAGTTIDLRIQRHATQCRIEVSDQGSGIAPDEHALVFQRYQRGRNAEHLPGAGLGLALVQRITELHGGCITLESHVGQGTRFIVDLPFNGPTVAPTI